MTELRLGQINTVDIDTSEFASANSVNTVQSNVTSLTSDVGTISANLNALPDSAANDYATYSTLSTLIDTVSSNASSHSSTFWEGYADSSALSGGYISNAFTVVSGVGAYFGDGGSWTQLATLASVNTVQDNVSALDNNAWVNANDYTTYNTLSGLIDTVQDNVSSSSSNTSIVVGGTDLSNTTVFVEAGDGVSLASNTTSKTVTISTSMSNVTSQEFTLDGSANSFTLAKSAANTHMILVFYNGIAQKPTSYTISGTTLTLSNTRPIAASSDLEVRYFDFFEQPGVSESSGGGGYSFQGSSYGYSSSGTVTPFTDIIDKYSFTSDAPGTNIGVLPRKVTFAAGQSSSTHGYASGGSVPAGNLQNNQVDKFPFSSDTDATDVFNLSYSNYGQTGNSSETDGYASGGQFSLTDTISKFTFSSDANAVNVGELTSSRGTASGQSSSSYGYISGGKKPTIGGYGSTVIDKFSFTSMVSATSVGSLTQGRYGLAGQNSSTDGYASGGAVAPNNPQVSYNTIDKFPFATDTNATDIANLTFDRFQTTGTSSTTNGYTAGGKRQPSNPDYVDMIDKFPFSSDSNATDVGELSSRRAQASSQQY